MPPTEKLALPIFPTPAWRVKSPLIRRFGLEPQWVRTLSTHAIASQAQSHRLNGNLTRLVRNSLTLVSEVLKKGRCPFRRLASPISPIPTRNVSFFQSSVRAKRNFRFAHFFTFTRCPQRRPSKKIPLHFQKNIKNHHPTKRAEES